jgi:hypothetical protein
MNGFQSIIGSFFWQTLYHIWKLFAGKRNSQKAAGPRAEPLKPPISGAYRNDGAKNPRLEGMDFYGE